MALHYTGSLTNGKEFDTSRDGDLPFEFRIGHGGAIEGWQLIAEQMQVGDRWKATIPSALAYGPNGFPPVIPPNADLVFDMELVRVR